MVGASQGHQMQWAAAVRQWRSGRRRRGRQPVRCSSVGLSRGGRRAGEYARGGGVADSRQRGEYASEAAGGEPGASRVPVAAAGGGWDLGDWALALNGGGGGGLRWLPWWAMRRYRYRAHGAGSTSESMRIEEQQAPRDHDEECTCSGC